MLILRSTNIEILNLLFFFFFHSFLQNWIHLISQIRIKFRFRTLGFVCNPQSNEILRNSPLYWQVTCSRMLFPLVLPAFHWCWAWLALEVRICRFTKPPTGRSSLIGAQRGRPLNFLTASLLRLTSISPLHPIYLKETHSSKEVV